MATHVHEHLDDCAAAKLARTDARERISFHALRKWTNASRAIKSAGAGITGLLAFSELPTVAALPDPFEMSTRQRIASRADWALSARGDRRQDSAVRARNEAKALGVPDRIGYAQVGGHGHCQFPSADMANVAAFVDKFLLGKDGATNVATTPYRTDLTKWITWQTPQLN